MVTTIRRSSPTTGTTRVTTAGVYSLNKKFASPEMNEDHA